MRLRSVRNCRGCLLAAALLLPSQAQVAERAAGEPREQTIAEAAVPAGVAEYRRKLEAYTRARQTFEEESRVYWASVADKRRIRNGKRRDKQDILLDDYVLTQPPLFAGPPRPADPSGRPEIVPPRPYVPVVADFLTAAAEHFNFVPQRPQSEIAYKRAYAKVASAAGLARDQAVRIYGFESGGNGRYDVQAGLEQSRPGARAISTALGYNQLLTTNTVSLLAEHGDRFIMTLLAKAAASSGASQQVLEGKVAVLKRMVEFSRTVPNRWSEHDKLANTPQGLGTHALNLDLDVGPHLQTQKLMDSVVFARRRGHTAPLTAAELEMMNLTGDGNGFDIVSMPAEMRDKVPTSNFFLQGGYERNPVAIRNNVVAKLLAATDARMDHEVKKQGAKDLAAAF